MTTKLLLLAIIGLIIGRLFRLLSRVESSQIALLESIIMLVCGFVAALLMAELSE